MSTQPIWYPWAGTFAMGIVIFFVGLLFKRQERRKRQNVTKEQAKS